jgi:hypothetical protein
MEAGSNSPGAGVRSGKRKLLVRMWGEIEEVVEGDVGGGNAGVGIRESNQRSDSCDDVEQSTKELVALVKGAGGTAVGTMASAAGWSAKGLPFKIRGGRIDDVAEDSERSLADVQLSHLHSSSGDGREGTNTSDNNSRKRVSVPSRQQYDDDDSSQEEGEAYGWHTDGKPHDVRWDSVLHAGMEHHPHPQRAALDQLDSHDRRQVQSYYTRDTDYEHAQAGALLKRDDSGSESESEQPGVGLVSNRTGQRRWLRNNPNAALC